MTRAAGCRGLSLVETLVAMAVFAVGISALAPLIVSTVRGNQAASVRSRALALAQETVEDLKAQTYEAVLATAAATDVVDGVYTRSLQVLDVPALAGDEDDLRRLAVTVSWQLPGQGPGSVTLVTSRARY